jgi:hypothetical protein
VWRLSFTMPSSQLPWDESRSLKVKVRRVITLCSGWNKLFTGTFFKSFLLHIFLRSHWHMFRKTVCHFLMNFTRKTNTRKSVSCVFELFIKHDLKSVECFQTSGNLAVKKWFISNYSIFKQSNKIFFKICSHFGLSWNTFLRCELIFFYPGYDFCFSFKI